MMGLDVVAAGIGHGSRRPRNEGENPCHSGVEDLFVKITVAYRLDDPGIVAGSIAGHFEIEPGA